jgi:serine protease
MIRRRPSLAVAALAAACALSSAPASAATAPRVSGEVVVKYAEPRDAGGSSARAATARPRGPVVRRVRDVDAAVAALRRRPDVAYAAPNVKARASGYVPNDPGRTATTPAGWQSVQWNFAGPFGVHAPEAWERLNALGRPGAKGIVIAVLDTGVAYRNRGAYRASPDLELARFIKGYDFVDHDQFPLDRNGHGTHIASTIVEATGNGVALTGLAYGAHVMPLRVLNDAGEGDAFAIAQGVRYAARKGVDIINMSLEFSSDVRALEIPELLDAIDYAHRRGALVVGASGNEGTRSVAYPARADHVVSVASTTEHGCVSDFSNQGRGLDIAAPGGGEDAPFPDDPNCHPEQPAGRDIYQVTLTGPRGHSRFGIPGAYQGTSMAAAHVSGVAALVLASGTLGPKPSPLALERHLEATSRDLGPIGPDSRYGAGLIDADRATAPRP